MRMTPTRGDALEAPDLRAGEIDLAMLARAIWAKKWFALVPVMLAFVVSALVVQFITPEYKSAASVLLQPQESSFTRPIVDQRVDPLIDEQAVSSEVQVRDRNIHQLRCRC